MDFDQFGGIYLPKSVDLGRLEALRHDDVKVSPEKIRALVALHEAIKEREQYSGIDKWFVPGGPYSIENCPKHKAFFDAGKHYSQRGFIAGNRVGKTQAGSYESALHLTGDYPEWWDGKVFDHPTSGWSVGNTAKTTRDTVQKELLGDIGQFGTGTIPRERIIKVTSKSGTANAIDTILVQHVSGGVSNATFKSYEEEMKSFMGPLKHWVHLDEECPELIYNECLIRTIMCHGVIYVTFTPLHGMTEFISNFDSAADHLAGAVPILADVDEMLANA